MIGRSTQGGAVRAPLNTLSAVGVSLFVLILTACPPGPAITTQVTNVGLSVGTVVKTSGIIDVNNNCNSAVPPAPNVQSWWNALPPNNRRFPFVGFEIWRNTFDGCTTTRLDVYRALVTFNMTGVSQLKGLVKSATLNVSTRALPAGVGAHASCIAFTGGAGTLGRFGPTVAALPVAGNGMLTQLQPADPFPTATNTVFAFPMPWVSGAVAGAANPTTSLASGTGGASFTVDVTNSVIAALNAGMAGMSWMLTSSFEGPLPGPSAVSVDCKTSYALALAIEHY
jgi:hypothetical protein